MMRARPGERESYTISRLDLFLESCRCLCVVHKHVEGTNGNKNRVVR
jgi:hypothetical protein